MNQPTQFNAKSADSILHRFFIRYDNFEKEFSVSELDLLKILTGADISVNEFQTSGIDFFCNQRNLCIICINFMCRLYGITLVIFT